MIDLLSQAKFTRVLNYTAGGAGDEIASDAVDTQGFHSLAFAVVMGQIAAPATGSIRAQQSHDSNSADAWADLAGSGSDFTNAAENSIILVELIQPQERYIRAVVARDVNTGNTTLDGIIAIQSAGGDQPVTQPASVFASKVLPSPAEGTA